MNRARLAQLWADLRAWFLRPRGSAAVMQAAADSFSLTLRAMVPHCLCGHIQREHSEVLPDAPCLECDCPAWMVKT